jgi:hypothetical protein
LKLFQLYFSSSLIVGDINKAVEELVTVITEQEIEQNGGICELDEKSIFADEKSSN